jgi:hypothetical protein
MIQEEGIVSTGAGMHSPHPLQVMAKSQNRTGNPTNMEPSIGEEKAKCPAASRSASGLGRRRAVPGLPRRSAGAWKIGDFSDAP